MILVLRRANSNGLAQRSHEGDTDAIMVDARESTTRNLDSRRSKSAATRPDAHSDQTVLRAPRFLSLGALALTQTRRWWQWRFLHHLHAAALLRGQPVRPKNHPSRALCRPLLMPREAHVAGNTSQPHHCRHALLPTCIVSVQIFRAVLASWTRTCLFSKDKPHTRLTGLQPQHASMSLPILSLVSHRDTAPRVRHQPCKPTSKAK